MSKKPESRRLNRPGKPTPIVTGAPKPKTPIGSMGSLFSPKPQMKGKDGGIGF